MGFDQDLALAKSYPILDLVRECQEGLGYTHGLVTPSWDRDQKTRCPVHYDESPSAKAYVDSNSVYCWVCNRTWDPPALYTTAHGVSVYRAIKELLGRMGVASSGTVDDLKAFSSKLEPPRAVLDPAAVESWIVSVWLWAMSYADRASHLDVVAEECEFARRHVAEDPAWSLSFVRGYLDWAYKLGDLRGCPVPPPECEAPDALFLAGLPPS